MNNSDERDYAEEDANRADMIREGEHEIEAERLSARLTRVRLEDELGTLRHAEQIARAHGQDKLADDLYGFGCSLGSPDAQREMVDAWPDPDARPTY